MRGGQEEATASPGGAATAAPFILAGGEREESGRACCTWLGPGRDDAAVLVGLAHGDPRSVPPARFRSRTAETASPGHTGLVYDYPGLVPQRDSGCDSPEQLEYAAPAWEGRSAALDTDADCEL
uniref:Uncharacterized protein n=1 Tax=Ixodes ricinus TaxID=34613 RepID=A0A6B0UNY5_IXORI